MSSKHTQEDVINAHPLGNEGGAPYFKDEKAFWHALDLLNQTAGRYSPWQARGANKRHTDLFGVQIQTGETYYSREVGVAFDAIVRLSRASMEKLLYAVVSTSPCYESLAELLLAEEQARARAAIDRVEASRRGHDTK